MHSDTINKLQAEIVDNRDLKEYSKNINPQLTKDDVHKILNYFQNMLFEHNIHTDDVLEKIQTNGISADVLEAVAEMVTNSADTYSLISECYDVNVINCFIYAVLKTLQIFMTSTLKKYNDYGVLIIDRYFNKKRYETDNDYELDNDIDQSSFSRKKKNALTAFAKRLNAELKNLHCSETSIKSDRCTDNDSVYSATFNFLFANADISQYFTQLNKSIFRHHVSR